MLEAGNEALSKIVNEYANKLPTPPNGVRSKGLVIDNGELVFDLDLPRWFRHPEEYGGNKVSDSPKYKAISDYEDTLYYALEKIRKKYNMPIDIYRV